MDKLTLVTQEVDCSNITKETFVELMFKNLKEAIKVYDAYWLPIEKKRHEESVERSIEYTLKRAQSYAEKKWKTEKKRQEYIENEMANFKPSEFWYSELTFFDFDVEPWRNGLSGNCCLNTKNVTSKQLENCFETIKDNKYFKQAKGWILEDHHGFRPQIKLILSEEVQKQFDKDEQDLADDIRRFYANCSYPGD